jgi:hypothetical protein
MRNFIVIRPEILNNGLCYIATSTERFHISRELHSRKAIDFLFSLQSLAKRKEYANAVYVWYNTQTQVEQLLKDLPDKAKDIAFPLPEMNDYRKHLRASITSYQGMKRGRVINERLKSLRKRLHDLEYIYYSGYRLRVRAGKSLTITKLNEQGASTRSITIFDVWHFFNKDTLQDTAARFLDYSPIKYDALDILPLIDAGEAQGLERLREQLELEANATVDLCRKLGDYLTCANIKLKRWYGPSSAVNTLLKQWNVRREFRPITPKNTPRVLHHAFDCAFVGGRIETTKLGMLRDVYVYDLNSAFAWAVTLLPNLTRGWRYTREYDASEQFALWHVEYDLPSSIYVGMLPHRKGNGSIVYRRAGRGWYYAPEVAELARMYPDNFRVREGYIVPFLPISFAERINELYTHRQYLIAKEGKGKGEKIFKSILHCFYGKFAQVVGESPYLCLPWAGWITSYIRAQMLRIVRGCEQHAVYFHTDAVHSTVPLPGASCGVNLGEWTVNHYPFAFYLASGVHCFYDETGNVIKSATRGFEFIDFDEAISELNNPENAGRVTLRREFFAGHAYKRAFPARGEYLQTLAETQSFDPRETRARNFSRAAFDWRESYIDSRIVDFDDGRESAPRKDMELATRLHLALDVQR